VQGHIAYPHLARNPIHMVAPALAELAAIVWDDGNALLSADHLAGFEHPCRHRRRQRRSGHGESSSTSAFPPPARRRAAGAVGEILDRHGVEYDLHWTLSGQPYLTPRGGWWTPPCRAGDPRNPRHRDRTVHQRRHLRRPLHRRHLPEVIELGPLNATIHKIDECIAAVADIEPLPRAGCCTHCTCRSTGWNPFLTRS
jgi:succinyl-diaminopimelate desuccinylase